MESILKILLLISATFSTVHAYYDDLCPTSTCGSLSMYYPFKLPNFQPKADNCSYFDLTCDTANQTTTLTLPYSGDFHVLHIAYNPRQIQLRDPDNCLMGRLMKNNLNLSSSPFLAVSYENYTFYTCPPDSGIISPGLLSPIGCLSNSTSSMVATAFISRQFMLSIGCESVGTWELPVLGTGQFENDGITSDLYLTWDFDTCVDCQQSDDGGDGGEVGL